MNKTKKKQNRGKNVLICLRSDKEKSLEANQTDKLIKKLSRYGYSVQTTDMISKHDAFIGFRKKLVENKLKMFQKSGLLITDRLHGMYFAAITNTPCLILDNISGKVLGGYKEWLQDYQNIGVLDENITDKELDRIINCKHMEKSVYVDSQFINEKKVLQELFVQEEA